MLFPPPPVVEQALPALVTGSLQLTAPRHRAAVHGSVDVSATGAGGRLEVDLLATRAALTTHHAMRVVVGHLIRPSVLVGRVTFTVTLNGRGRTALRRHHHIALIVRVVLTPTAGAAIALTRSLVLRA
jgi:hypothetical protein